MYLPFLIEGFSRQLQQTRRSDYKLIFPMKVKAQVKPKERWMTRGSRRSLVAL